MNRIICITCMAALAGCATVEPRVSTVTNTVSVPTPIACLKASDIPPRPTPTPIATGATHDQKDAAQAADLLAYDGYAAITDPLLRQCAAP